MHHRSQMHRIRRGSSAQTYQTILVLYTNCILNLELYIVELYIPLVYNFDVSILS